MNEIKFNRREDSHGNRLCSLIIDGELAYTARAMRDGQNDAIWYVDIYSGNVGDVSTGFIKTSMAQGADLERWMTQELLATLAFMGATQITPARI